MATRKRINQALIVVNKTGEKEGKDILQTKRVSGLLPSATDDKLYLFAEAVSSLMQGTLKIVKDSETSQLTK